MFGEFETREGDFKAERPYDEDRRKTPRRRNGAETWDAGDRRKRTERRIDADWRFSLIRRTMRGIRDSKFHFA